MEAFGNDSRKGCVQDPVLYSILQQIQLTAGNEHYVLRAPYFEALCSFLSGKAGHGGSCLMLPRRSRSFIVVPDS